MKAAAYKKETAAGHLRRARDRLIAAELEKGPLEDFLSHHTALLDQYFMESFEESMIGPKMHFHKTPYAMIALGGYGRRELCLHSDIDLLVLFEKSVPPESEDLIREAVYPLWDLGFDVGHATRSIKESLLLAADDMDVLTSLLDARFLCGSSPLYTELRERLDQHLAGKRGRKTIRHLMEGNRERYERFGDSSYLLEPNLKEGRGGLRDYHTMLWIARVRSGIMQPRDLEYNGDLSHDEFERLREALGFIWKVRNQLHELSGRKSDQLFFEHQEKIADLLGFEAARGQMAVERFLGRLHEHMEYIKQTSLVFLMEAGQDRRSRPRRQSSGKRHTVPGLETEGDMLGFTSTEHILDAPHLLIKIFEESARLGLRLSSEARRIVAEFLFLVDEPFRGDPRNIEAFEKILITPAGTFNVLNEMRRTGFLARLIPEMESIVNRIQYDGYHLYPIDRHSLHTVKMAKQFSSKENGDALSASLFRELGGEKKWLLWAALLHDIGKGEAGTGHAGKGARIAARILGRFGYDAGAVEIVSFLIEEHLLLVKTATRRDLHDEETAISCARRVKDAHRLKMLYLLTVADSMATGPKAWNDWTAELLRDLFFKVLKILEKGELASREAVEAVETKRRALLDGAASGHERETLERHLDRLSPRYLLYMPDHDIAEHRLLFQNLGEAPFVWDISDKGASLTRTVTVCAHDHPGLFSKIAGVFTLNGLDILKADVFTWKDDIALDIFVVRPPADLIYEEEKWKKAKAHLQAAIRGDLDLSEALGHETSVRRAASPEGARPRRIEVDNESSSFFTLIEVFSYDLPGLLFRVTDALFRQGLDVRTAKIATKIDQVVDVFYVRDLEGQKVESPERLESIRDSLEAVLVGPPDNKTTKERRNFG